MSPYYQFKNELTEALMELGLTSTQARTYAALCQLGRSNATLIAKESNIARQDIYRILRELQDMGFVKKDIVTPVIYEGIPLTESISTMMEDRIKKTHDLQKKIRQLFYHISTQKDTAPSSEKQNFRIIPHGRPYIAEGKKGIATAKVEVSCITPLRVFLQMTMLADKEINEAIKRGVAFKYLLDEPFDEKSKKRFNNQLFTFGYLPDFSFFGTIASIFDKKMVQIAISDNGSLTKNSMLLSTCPEIVSIVDNYLGILWSQQAITC